MVRKKKTRFFLKRVFFFWSKTPSDDTLFSERERDLLEQENEESSKHAMPDATTGNAFGDGNFFNNISRIQSTTNQNGLGAIVERRVIEPRSGQSPVDQESL